MDSVEEFTLNFKVEVSNEGAADRLSKKQKEIIDQQKNYNSRQFINQITSGFDALRDSLLKASPEASRVLDTLTKIASVVRDTGIFTSRNSSSSSSGTTVKTTKIKDVADEPFEKPIKAASPPSSSRALVPAGSNSLTTTSEGAVAQAEGMAAEGAAAEGAVGLSVAFAAAAAAAATVVGAFVLVTKSVQYFNAEFEKQFKTGHRIGASEYQVENMQRSLTTAGKGLISRDESRELIEKVSSYFETAASSANPTNRNELTLMQMGVSSRDKNGQFVGNQKALENLSDAFGKMTDEAARAYGAQIGLNYQEIEAIRNNSAAIRKQTELTDEEIATRQRAQEAILEVKKAQTEMRNEWNKFSQLLAVTVIPIINKVRVAIYNFATKLMEIGEMIAHYTGWGHVQKGEKTDEQKALKERSLQEDHQANEAKKREVDVRRNMNLFADSVQKFADAVGSSGTIWAAWAGEFANQHQLNAGSQAPQPLLSTKTQGVAGTIRYDDQINKAAKQSGVDANVLKALMMQESGGKTGQVSSKGARGLFQFMPKTAKEYGIYGQEDNPLKVIPAAARKLAADLKYYHGDYSKALSAWNYGNGKYDRWLANGANPNKLPKETRNFYPSIMRRINPSYANNTPHTNNNPHGMDREQVYKSLAFKGISETLGVSTQQLTTGIGVSKGDLRQLEAPYLENLQLHIDAEMQKHKALGAINQSGKGTIKTIQDAKDALNQLVSAQLSLQVQQKTFDELIARAQINERQRTVGLPDMSHYHLNVNINGAKNPEAIAQEIHKYIQDLAQRSGSGKHL